MYVKVKEHKTLFNAFRPQFPFSRGKVMIFAAARTGTCYSSSRRGDQAALNHTLHKAMSHFIMQTDFPSYIFVDFVNFLTNIALKLFVDDPTSHLKGCLRAAGLERSSSLGNNKRKVMSYEKLLQGQKERS
jgi:hypothetical protein